ncbi:MAG: ABC transporter substrate-binding protein [Bauldia sp.]|jgi:putative ABC transport system substrate-binding protein
MSVDRRRFMLGAAGSLLGAGFARAQGRIPLIAAMIGAYPPPDPTGIEWANAILAGLQDQGWPTVRSEFRFTAGQTEATAQFAAELVAMAPDVIITGTPPNSILVHSLTRTIPQVFVAVPDPIGDGLVESYARPGGNATGVTHVEPPIGGKMVELLMELAPATRRIAYLTNPDTYTLPMLPYATEAALRYGVEVSTVDVHALDQIAPAIADIAAWGGAGIVMPGNNWVHNNAPFFVAPINEHRIPAIYPAHRMAEAGGLIALGIYTTQMFRLGGNYAGRILNGASPSTLPVQRPPFGVVLNLRTANLLGITIPRAILVAVDRFIE